LNDELCDVKVMVEMARKILISEEALRKIAKGKIKYTGKKIKPGRWILKEKIGDFIGSKSKD